MKKVGVWVLMTEACTERWTMLVIMSLSLLKIKLKPI